MNDTHDTTKSIKHLLHFFHKDMILPATFGTLSFSLLWNPLKPQAIAASSAHYADESVSAFSRQIGQALIYGIDIEKRISHLTFWGFFYLPVLFFVIWFILSRLFQKKTVSSEGMKFLYTLICASVPALIVSQVYRLDAGVFSPISPICFLAILATLLYLMLGERLLSLNGYRWAFFTSLLLTILILLIVNIHFERLDASNPFFVGSAYVIILFLFFICAISAENSSSPSTIYAASTPLYVAPIIVSLQLEIFQILNRYGVYFAHRTFVLLGTLFVLAFAGLLWYLISRNKKCEYERNYLNPQYFLLVIGFATLYLRPHMVAAVVGNELFESSNLGSDIYGLLADGEIPLIENLNVHMLLEDIGSILYGTLNKDAIGASFYGYPIIDLLIYLVIYALFTALTDRETACILTIFMPINLITWGFPYIIGAFPFALIVYVIREHSMKSYILFVVSCVFACLYRADIGMSCGMSSVIILTVYLLWKRRFPEVGILWISGFVAGSLLLGAFLLLCIYRGISPLARLLEFVSIMGDSNTGWAYAKVSNSYGFLFYLCYLIVPTASVLSAVLLFSERQKRAVCTEHILFVFAVVLADILLFSRGIVRHNLTEGFTCFSIGLSTLGVIFSMWLLAGHRQEYLPLFLCLALLIQLFATGSIQQGLPLMTNTINRQTSADEKTVYMETVDRVRIPESTTVYSDTLRAIFDYTLDPSQSFFDYSYQTTLYIFTGRNKPVYTNQSPSQLNHEFDHLLFLKELNEIDCPYAVSVTTGSGHDGIDIDMAHYLIAEYLYDNYRPLCTVGPYCLWTRNGEYDLRREQVEELCNSGAVVVSFVTGSEQEFYRSYEMGYVPFLWGTYDKAEKQQLLAAAVEINDTEDETARERLFTVPAERIEKKDGNYIEIIASADREAKAWIDLLSEDGASLCRVSFILEEGENRYLVRISANRMWHGDTAKVIRLESEADLDEVTVNILRGDIDYGSMNVLQQKVLEMNLNLNA